MICVSCGIEFDPDNDFVEDTEMLEALNFFTDISKVCAKCLYKMRDEMEVVSNFMTAEKH